MKKTKLTKFINKYYLNGQVNSVILGSKDNVLITKFTTEDRTLLGELSMNSWDAENAILGVFNTEHLIKLLGVLSDDIQLDLQKNGNQITALKLSDDYATVNFMLADISIFSELPKIKYTPEFQIKIEIDTKFISTFIAGTNALSEGDTFTVLSSNNTVSIVIGHSNINTNTVTIPVKSQIFEPLQNITFNAELFKNILVANKECEIGLLEISSEGLSRITFNVDEYKAVYHLISNSELE